ncbi:MAG: hypothetical protein ACXQT3_02240 [Methermicoccaceae archaeon]
MNKIEEFREGGKGSAHLLMLGDPMRECGEESTSFLNLQEV